MAQSTSPAPPGSTVSATVTTLPGVGSAAALSPAQAIPPTSVAAASKLPLRQSTPRRRRGGALRPDELTERRERLRAERQEVEKRAEDRLHQMQVQEFIRVPRLMVAITNGLAAASVLELARLWTERSMHERGTPWVDMPVQTWLNYTGLCEHEWVEARRALRSMRLIREQRRFDLARNELVCDIAFEPEAFAGHVADLKDALKVRLSEEVRARHRVARDSERPGSPAQRG